MGDISIAPPLAEGDGEHPREFAIPPGRPVLLALGVGVKRELEPLSGVNNGMEHFCGGVWGIYDDNDNRGERGGDDGPALCEREEKKSSDASEAANTGQESFTATGGGGSDFGASGDAFDFAFRSVLGSCLSLL